jgi:hypothetical protein
MICAARDRAVCAASLDDPFALAFIATSIEKLESEKAALHPEQE